MCVKEIVISLKVNGTLNEKEYTGTYFRQIRASIDFANNPMKNDIVAWNAAQIWNKSLLILCPISSVDGKAGYPQPTSICSTFTVETVRRPEDEWVFISHSSTYELQMSHTRLAERASCTLHCNTVLHMLGIAALLRDVWALGKIYGSTYLATIYASAFLAV